MEGALDLTRETGDRRIEGYALEGLGHVLEAAGETKEAGRRYEEALKLRREINFAKGVAETLVALGRFWAALGEQDAARTLLDEAIAIARELKTPEVEVLASCLKADGDADAALAAFSEHEARIGHGTKREARFCLWKATADRAHLQAAHRLLMYAREHASEEYRDSMIENVPFHRDIMKAWEEHGEKR